MLLNLLVNSTYFFWNVAYSTHICHYTQTAVYLRQPLHGNISSYFLAWIYINFPTRYWQRWNTKTIIHSHCIHTGGGSNSCPAADRRKLPICDKTPHRSPPNIHSHSYEAIWVKCLSKDTMTETKTQRGSNCQPFGYWMTWRYYLIFKCKAGNPQLPF